MKALSGREFARLVERRGWRLLRINGSHHIYGKSGSVVRLSIPIHGNRPLKLGCCVTWPSSPKSRTRKSAEAARDGCRAGRLISPLAAEKRLERCLRLLRLEPPLEKLRLLVDPPHDLGGGAADQPSRRRHGFGRQRRDLARGL